MKESNFPDLLRLIWKFLNELVGGITFLKFQFKNFFVRHLEVIIDVSLSKLTTPHLVLIGLKPTILGG